MKTDSERALKYFIKPYKTLSSLFLISLNNFCILSQKHELLKKDLDSSPTCLWIIPGVSKILPGTSSIVFPTLTLNVSKHTSFRRLFNPLNKMSIAMIKT